MRAQENLELVYLPVKPDLDQVERELRRSSPSGYGEISQSVDHVLSSEGKRIRPALVILAARACGKNCGGEAVKMAVAAELFHTATLVSDDIVDGSGFRRGEETVNSRWGTEAAILSAQYLYLRSLMLAGDVGLNGRSGDFSRLMVETARKMLEGELKDFDAGRGRRLMTEQEYMEIVRDKTAALFAACSRAGAMLADADRRVLDALFSFGENLGMAFQIVDDVLDIVADEKVLGKPVGSDIRTCRMTLPLIHHLSASSRSGKTTSPLSNAGPGMDVEELRSLLETTRSVDYSLRVAKRYANVAEGSLGVLEETAYKRSLAALARYAVSRSM